MTKLGYHLTGLNPGNVAEVFKRKPPIIKIVDHFDVNFLQRYRDEVGGFVIGRMYLTPQFVGEYLAEAGKMGQELGAKVARIEAVKLGLIDVFESYNEPFSFSDNPKEDEEKNHRHYDWFQDQFRHTLMHDTHGKTEAVGGNFAAGNGLGRTWLKYYPYVLTEYKYLGFHEYDWPSIFTMHQQGVKDGNGGMWLGLRYRRIMNVVRPLYDHHKVIITECGIGQGVYPPNPDVGWKTGVQAEAYAQDLKLYDKELHRDNYVLGGVVYQTGGGGEWASFEIVDEITGRMGYAT